MKAKRIYAHLLEPEKHSDYSRRKIKVPTWQTFGGRQLFVILRAFAQKDGLLVNYKEDLDLYTQELKLGTVIWPFFNTLFAKNFTEFVDEVKRRDLYLFDFWGHVPGSGMEGTWSHVMPPPGTVDYLEETLGGHFLGIDNGEQDGRYMRYATQMCPASAGRTRQYANFQRHFERMGNDLGNRMAALVSLTFGHYFLKEGNTMLIGAETAQGLINSQIYYSFIRGAGKQYGIMWFGNASICNRASYKCYEEEKACDYSYGPDYGTSLMLLRRLIYTHYLYNCAILGFEQGWILGDNPWRHIEHLPVPVENDPSPKVLTPIGRIQASAKSFVDKHGSPGAMCAPLCVMLDFHSGWTVPRHLYTNKLYQVWGAVPYAAGDYLTHGIFAMLYPGYEDSSFYADEGGFLSPTPYGDISEVLLTDAGRQALGMYGTVVLGGEVSPSLELKSKLEAFVGNGGRLIATAGNLAKFAGGLCGLEVGGEARPVSGTVRVGKLEIEEEVPFRLFQLASTKGFKTLAACGKAPAAVKARWGAGEIVLFLSPFGIAEGETGPLPLDGNTMQVPLPNPHPLLKHVAAILDTVFKDAALFEAGDGLGHIACRKGDGLYTLGIYNNSLKETPFKIKSRIGTVKGIRELPLDCSEKGAPGYWPVGFKGTDTGVNTASSIAGGDIRIFEVTLDEKGVVALPPAKPEAPPQHRLLALRDIRSIKEEILRRPTFFQHFSGVKVDWDYFHNRDAGAVKAESAWFRLQRLEMLTDFSKGFNFYPDLTLLDNLQWRFEESFKAILDTFDKMALAGATDAVFSLHRLPENHFTSEQTSESFLKNVRRLCVEAEQRGITLYLQAHPNKWHSGEGMARFILDVAARNLKPCLNVCHVLMGEGRPAAEPFPLLLLSVPERDFQGQSYDAHRPVAGSPFEDVAREMLKQLAQDGTVVLDAEYASHDDEFRDVSLLDAEINQENGTR